MRTVPYRVAACMSTGHAFGGAQAQALERRLQALARENRQRRPCPHCGLAISLSGFERHVTLCAE
jgi:hypothetical protein